MRPKAVKHVKVGRNCGLTIIKRDNQWKPYQIVSFDGRGFQVPAEAANMRDARAAAAAEARKLRRTAICRRGLR